MSPNCTLFNFRLFFTFIKSTPSLNLLILSACFNSNSDNSFNVTLSLLL